MRTVRRDSTRRVDPGISARGDKPFHHAEPGSIACGGRIPAYTGKFHPLIITPSSSGKPDYAETGQLVPRRCLARLESLWGRAFAGRRMSGLASLLRHGVRKFHGICETSGLGTPSRDHVGNVERDRTWHSMCSRLGVSCRANSSFSDSPLMLMCMCFAGSERTSLDLPPRSATSDTNVTP